MSTIIRRKVFIFLQINTVLFPPIFNSFLYLFIYFFYFSFLQVWFVVCFRQRSFTLSNCEYLSGRRARKCNSAVSPASRDARLETDRGGLGKGERGGGMRGRHRREWKNTRKPASLLRQPPVYRRTDKRLYPQLLGHISARVSFPLFIIDSDRRLVSV